MYYYKKLLKDQLAKTEASIKIVIPDVDTNEDPVKTRTRKKPIEP